MQMVAEVTGVRAEEGEQARRTGSGCKHLLLCTVTAIQSGSQRSWAGAAVTTARFHWGRTELVPANAAAPDTSCHPLKPVGVSPSRTTAHSLKKPFRLGNLKSFSFAPLVMFSRPFLFAFLLTQVCFPQIPFHTHLFSNSTINSDSFIPPGWKSERETRKGSLTAESTFFDRNLKCFDSLL